MGVAVGSGDFVTESVVPEASVEFKAEDPAGVIIVPSIGMLLHKGDAETYEVLPANAEYHLHDVGAFVLKSNCSAHGTVEFKGKGPKPAPATEEASNEPFKAPPTNANEKAADEPSAKKTRKKAADV
jgi:hypothetical protein